MSNGRPVYKLIPARLQRVAEHLLAQWHLRHTPGRRGEKLAAKHLKKLGYRILATNVNCGQYEIDILARTPDGKTMVIAEVKTVINPVPNSPPELRADAHKWKRLELATHYLIKRYKIQQTQIRFDLLAIELPADAPPVIRHTPDAWRMGRPKR